MEQTRPVGAALDSKAHVRPSSEFLPTARRALIVDDAPSNRKLFAMHVKKLGFTITEAGNGREALDACGVDSGAKEIDEVAKEPFSIVFMDSVRLACDVCLVTPGS